MSRLSDALGVPEGKPFDFCGSTYVVRGNTRYKQDIHGKAEWCASEVGLCGMIDNAFKIKLLPTRYKRKEPEIVEAYKLGTPNAPCWVTKQRNSTVGLMQWYKNGKVIRSASVGEYVVLDSNNRLHEYTAEEFESTFEEME